MGVEALPPRLAELSSIHEAHDRLQKAFADQLERSIVESAEPNVAVDGDAAVRKAFWMLLPPDEQRSFFLARMGDRSYWPRLRTLIGPPPYSFLRPEDEGGLRATGICASRVNLVHSEISPTAYAEFGGHLEDSAGRLYRIVQRERSATSTLLPWEGLVAGMRVVADVRVPKRTKQTKMEIVKGNRGSITMASLVFPRIGDVVTLRRVEALRDRLDPSTGDPVRARVEVGKQRAPGSPVARLVLKFGS